MSVSDTKYITLGRFGKTHGLKGWLRVNSETELKESILDYTPWLIDNQGKMQNVTITGNMRHSDTLLVHIEGYDNSEDAKALTGKFIQIERVLLPELDDDEFYWADLEGLKVVTTDNQPLGEISHLMEAGACDVMVVKGEKEHLIPFDRDNVVKSVDKNAGIVVVDWDPEF